MVFELLTLVAIAVGAGLVTTTIWSRESTRVRLGAMVMFLALLPLLAGSGFMALSHPAPWIQTITVPDGDYEVLDVKFIQDVAIYVWLDFDGGSPRSFYHPWNNELADKLQGKMAGQYLTGERVYLRLSFDLSFDSEMQILELPQERMPNKFEVQVDPPYYDREE